NAANARLHWELTQVWLTVDADPKTRVVLVTGAGKAFSAGGDLALVEDMAGNPDALTRTMREASDLVYNMINLDKPVVSAINGVAVGAGLVVALMADVSIIAETARLTDGHTRLGVAAGDHAAILWPLLCGMAKAKYYLLTADFIDGREAERIGLVSMCVPPDQLMAKAPDVAAANSPAPRAGHPYHMHDAIYAQPGALRLVARGQGDAIEAAATRLRELDRVLLTGVGTSWHAALVGELLLARQGGLGHRA